MKELLETIVKALVERKDQAFVNEIKGEQATVLEISVAPEDMGKVIGKEGRIASSIRTIAKAAASVDHRRVTVEIIQKQNKN